MSKQIKHIKVIISGGGTGGHIFPALAIANEIKLRHPDAEILFVGAKGRMEMEKVPAAGYPIKGLWISGINRTQMWKNLVFPFKLLSSLYKSYRIIRQFKPDFVVGTGGFASGAILYVAQKKGIPTFIQEQNSYPGITNKLLAKNVLKIYTAYDGLEKFFNPKKIVKTGNPVRSDLQNIKVSKHEALTNFGLDGRRKTILVIGGSLGARPVNEAIEKILSYLRQNNYQLIWQTGKNHFENYQKYQDEYIKVLPFITRMQDAYAAADLIITRAGAGTISELSMVGKPVILVPSPYVAEDHQTKNALALANRQAAVLLPENELDKLAETITEILKNDEKKQQLSQNIQHFAMPDATKHIVDDILKTLKI